MLLSVRHNRFLWSAGSATRKATTYCCTLHRTSIPPQTNVVLKVVSFTREARNLEPAPFTKTFTKYPYWFITISIVAGDLRQIFRVLDRYSMRFSWRTLFPEMSGVCVSACVLIYRTSSCTPYDSYLGGLWSRGFILSPPGSCLLSIFVEQQTP